MKAVFSLTSPESKRLIAKAVIEMPEVKNALKNGKVVVAAGTTNAYIAEELSKKPIDKAQYSCGIITKGRQCLTPESKRIKALVFENGNLSDLDWSEALDTFTKGDVFIKGANAIDSNGDVGVLLASPTGGTIAKALAISVARGSSLIIPVGLEKMIPDVKEAANIAGIDTFERHIGKKVGLFPVSYGKKVTEIEALKILTGVEATCIAAGGVGGSEGSVVLVVEGEKEKIDKTMDIIKGIKGEKEIEPLKQSCSECNQRCEG